MPNRTFDTTRRNLLRAGLYGLGVGATLPLFFRNQALAADNAGERILVVLELAGGNDGLNTIVPYTNDAYYRARPKLGIAEKSVRKLDDEFGLHPSCSGLEQLYKDGNMAVIHGCGYPNPNLSHFTAMEWWHTAVPNGSDEYGWVGRLADAMQPEPVSNYLVNIATRQSFAVNSERHSPVVFNDPNKFGRIGTDAQQDVFEVFGSRTQSGNPSLDFINEVSHTATTGAAMVRNACTEYRTMVDYGSNNDLTSDLKKVAAMINAGLPTRVYYVSMGGFDTHAAQEGLHNTLMIYFSDAVRGFMADMERIGRADDVSMMVFSEFGRRVSENASGGTDHGTATPMYLIGKQVNGGFYGTHPSLTDLDDGNLRMTTDFRSVYATAMQGWLGFEDTRSVLYDDYPVLPVFG